MLKESRALILSENYIQAQEYLSKATVLSEKNGWHLERFNSLNYQGAIYHRLCDYSEALSYFLKAHELALEHLTENEESTILNNIVSIYLSENNSENNLEKAYEYQLKAYNLIKHSEDKKKVAVFSFNVANVLSELNKLDEAKEYLDTAFKDLNEADGYFWIKGRICLGKYYMLKGELSKAISVLEQEYSKKSSQDLQGIFTEVASMLSEVYSTQGNIEKAISLAKEGLSNTDVLVEKKRFYKMLSEYSFEQGAYIKALHFKDSLLNVSELLAKHRDAQTYESNKIKFDLQNYKNELKQNEENLKQERIIYIILVITISSLMYLVYRLLKNKLHKENQRKIIAEREQKILELELEKERDKHLLLEKQLKHVETNGLLEQERLKNEIEQKNRKLSAKALYLSGRNELIEDVIHSLSRLPSVKSNFELKSQVNTLKNHLRTDNEWDSFIAHFEAVNQEFIANLKSLHPDLNPNDIRFVCYVFMNLTTKEICAIFNITVEACRKRKTRIAKKMKIPQDMTLYDYVTKLSSPII